MLKITSFSEISFVTASRGVRTSRLLKIGHYTFSKQYTNGLRTRWFCSTHHSKGCRAFAHTYGDQVIKSNCIHSHHQPAK